MREILQTAAHFCKNFKLPISLPVESFTCAIGSQVLEDRTLSPIQSLIHVFLQDVLSNGCPRFILQLANDCFLFFISTVKSYKFVEFAFTQLYNQQGCQGFVENIRGLQSRDSQLYSLIRLKLWFLFKLNDATVHIHRILNSKAL